MIVAYHPTIFKGLQSITLGNPLQASLLRCAAEGISVYSPHSALDSVWGGINDWLAEGLMGAREGGEVKHLVGEKLHPGTGLSEGGEGRLVTLHEPIGFEKLVERVKSHLKLSQRQFLSLIDFSFFSDGLTLFFPIPWRCTPISQFKLATQQQLGADHPLYVLLLFAQAQVGLCSAGSRRTYTSREKCLM